MSKTHEKYCIYCGSILTNYATLNDGGTIVCLSCNGWFHLNIGNQAISAHKYTGAGPISCEICKKSGLLSSEK